MQGEESYHFQIVPEMRVFFEKINLQIAIHIPSDQVVEQVLQPGKSFRDHLQYKHGSTYNQHNSAYFVHDKQMLDTQLPRRSFFNLFSEEVVITVSIRPQGHQT